MDDNTEKETLIKTAKTILTHKLGMTEDKAHRHILKFAKDRCISKYKAAQMIIDHFLNSEGK